VRRQMDRDIAKWLGSQWKTPARILYLPGGPGKIGQCAVEQYDVIITKIEPKDLDNKDRMACLWRIGYEFAAPSGVLVLEFDGERPSGGDVYGKMSDIGWCRWDMLESTQTDIFVRTQRLAPWITNESIRRRCPNLITHQELGIDAEDTKRVEDCTTEGGGREAGDYSVHPGEETSESA